MKWMFLVAGGILLIGLIFAMVIIDLWHVHFGYAKAAERYRAAGMPWTTADLERLNPSVEGDAGSKFFALVSKFEGIQPTLPKTGPGLLTNDSVRLLDPYLASRTKLLDEYKPLADLPITWTKDWDLGMELLYPELAKMKEMAKAYAARSEVRSFRGDVQGSVEDIKLGAKLSRHAGRGGVMICHLVEVALRSIMLRAAQKSASYHLDDPKALESFADAVKVLEPNPNMALALKYEGFTTVTTLRNIDFSPFAKRPDPLAAEAENQPQKIDPKNVKRNGDPSTFINRSFAVPLLNVFAEAGETLRAKGESLDSAMEAASRMDAEVSKDGGLSASFAKQMTPVFKQAAMAGLKTAAEQRCTFAALKIASLRARKGSVTLDEINALLPEDPFNHKPLHVAVKGGIVKVWSVGEDGVDDGGLTKPDAAYMRAKQHAKPSEAETHDYVAELPFRPSMIAVERTKTEASSRAQTSMASGFAMP